MVSRSFFRHYSWIRLRYKPVELMRQIVFACEGGSYSQRRHEKKSTVRPPLSEDVLLVTECLPSRTMPFSRLPVKPKCRSSWVNSLLASIPEVHYLSVLLLLSDVRLSRNPLSALQISTLPTSDLRTGLESGLDCIDPGFG